ACDANGRAESRTLRGGCQQPQSAEGMANCDGVFRPSIDPFRTATDKAEIDETDFSAREMADHLAPDAAVKAPAMDQHKCKSAANWPLPQAAWSLSAPAR